MRLYSLTGATAVDDAEFGHISPADDGGFDLPGPLADRLHRTAIRGVRQWEDAIERQRRLIAEELERRRDPAALLTAVEQIIAAGKVAGQATPAESDAPAEKPASRAKAGAGKTAGK